MKHLLEKNDIYDNLTYQRINFDLSLSLTNINIYLSDIYKFLCYQCSVKVGEDSDGHVLYDVPEHHRKHFTKLIQVMDYMNYLKKEQS